MIVLVIVWVSTFRFVTQQLNRDLTIGIHVLEQALMDRERMLIDSAELLTADFGFRRTVATNDRATITSVLNNHVKRINADLMAILALDGQINVSVGHDITAISPAFIQHAASKAVVQGSSSDFVLIGKKLYQVVVVSVKAPRPIAIAMLGFEMNQALAGQLQATTGLQISFWAKNNEYNRVLSTLGNVDYTWLEASLQRDVWHIPYVRTGQFKSSKYSLVVNKTDEVNVFLSKSLDEIYQEFDYLQLTILLVSLITIPFSLLAAFLFSRNITRPIEHLVHAAKHIAAGQFKTKISKTSHSQEISELEDAFSVMQNNLLIREEKITFQATHDPITGLLNRDALINEITMCFKDDSTQLVGFNLANVGQINTVFGPAVADKYLNKAGQALAEFYPCVARISGGRFFCLPKQALGITEIERQCHQVALAIEKSELNMNADIRAGIVASSPCLRDAAHMISRLHITLDTAENDSHKVARYSDGQEQAYAQRLALVEKLRLLLAANPGGQLQMYYQPKLHIQSGKVTRLEALIRWFDEAGNFISPEVFIPLAEQSGLINALTEWVVEDVIRQLSAWQQQGLHFCVAINLSAQDINRSEMKPFICQCLKKYKVHAKNIILEITESEIMRYPEKAIATLSDFRNEGFSIAIDDFGTGYSSLSQLKNMPVTELKIDRDFIMKLMQDGNDKIIVQSTIELAHRFGLEVVAEGVEDQGALDFLAHLHCEWAQGYFIAKPMPANALQGWLVKRIIK